MAPRLNDDNNDNVSADKISMPMAIEPPSSLQIEWNGEFTTYDLAKQHIYVNGHLKAPTCEDSDRKPIDVVVVLDRSGSMAGDKLALCLKTVQFLIRELSAQDRLSVVSYDTTVRTDVPLTKMDRKGKATIEGALPRIRAGCSTNLSGGLLQGLEEVQSNHRSNGEEPNPVKSILLLTDGMANHGITSPPELVKLVDGVLNDDVSLFTFGYGAHHNETLLRQLSDVGRGVYYFVENPDGVSLAFADCLGGLLSVVAQNIKLECTTKNDCEVVSIKTKKEVKTIKEGTQYEIAVGDLYGEEERDILIELKLPAATALKSQKRDSSLTSILSSKMTYANVLQSSFESQVSDLALERTDKLPADRTPNSHILHQKNRIVTAEAMEEATMAANRGSFGQSKAILENAKNNISVSFQETGDLQCAQNFIEDLSACEGRVASRSAYEGGGRMQMSSDTQSHFMQRSNAVPSMDMMQMHMACASIASSAPSNAYRSKKKAGMMRRAFNFNK